MSEGLQIEGLTVRYGKHRALERVSLRVAPGEIVVILGANGAGKSSLLSAVACVCEGAVSGSVRLDGAEMTGQRADRIVTAGLALVPEGRGVFGDLTVRENLMLGAHAPAARAAEAEGLARAHELFPKLAERASQKVRTMSGGEQQMVAIGRAMLSAPRILMLDEPSLGLSPLLSKELFANLRRVRGLGLGVLLVEQNARQSLAIADRGYLLENGRITHEDTAAALARDPAVQAAYLGAAGKAAPDAAHPEVEAPPEAAAIPAIRPAPRPRATRSADAVLGARVDEIVARAAARSAEAVSASRATPGPQGMPDPGDRLHATLSELERAAREALRPVAERPTPRRAGVARRSVPARPLEGRAEPEMAGPPPVIEIYRAPRVEVWRRRPDATFERD